MPKCDHPQCTGVHNTAKSGLCPAALERKKQREKAWYEQTKEQGLCVACKAPVSGNNTKCDAHATAFRATQRTTYRKRKDAGLCPRCGLPTPRSHNCEPCQAKATAQAMKWQGSANGILARQREYATYNRDETPEERLQRLLME